MKWNNVKANPAVTGFNKAMNDRNNRESQMHRQGGNASSLCLKLLLLDRDNYLLRILMWAQPSSHGQTDARMLSYPQRRHSFTPFFLQRTWLNIYHGPSVAPHAGRHVECQRRMLRSTEDVSFGSPWPLQLCQEEVCVVQTQALELLWRQTVSSQLILSARHCHVLKCHIWLWGVSGEQIYLQSKLSLRKTTGHGGSLL